MKPNIIFQYTHTREQLEHAIKYEKTQFVYEYTLKIISVDGETYAIGGRTEQNYFMRFNSYIQDIWDMILNEPVFQPYIGGAHPSRVIIRIDRVRMGNPNRFLVERKKPKNGAN